MGLQDFAYMLPLTVYKVCQNLINSQKFDLIGEISIHCKTQILKGLQSVVAQQYACWPSDWTEVRKI